MKITRKLAEQIWLEHYGPCTFARDFHGNYMVFEGYGNPNYYRYFGGEIIYCGWNIHHIRPKSQGGPNAKNNLICTNIITNEMIADKTSFRLDDQNYQVRKTASGYTIVRL